MDREKITARALNLLRWQWRRFLAPVKTAWVPRARHFRRSLATAGVPLRKQFLELRCEEGKDVVGLFSEFAAVLGALEHYENWGSYYAGLRVRFTRGLYFDPAAGPDWWAYHFEPIDLGSDAAADLRVIGLHERDLFANRTEQAMARATGAALVARHVRVRPHLQAKVENFVLENFKDCPVIGVHFRGTDKWQDAPRVPYETVELAIRKAMHHLESSRCRIFLATDEQAFLDYMRKKFGENLLYREMFRSGDGRPIDVVNPDGNSRKGEDAVIDCLLLSRTHFLVRTSSNLGLCSTMFNPHLPVNLLNREQ